MTDQPTQRPLDDQAFFGPAPERLQTIADQAERTFADAGIRYGDALIALGNAHAIHASPATASLDAFEKALLVYSLVIPDSTRVADAHHRIAAMQRRLGEHRQGAEHLAKAIGIWEQTAEEQFLQLRRMELKELRSIHGNSQGRSVPPE
jgi:hypothetical protein